MPIALIIQYALQYGIPAAREIVLLFQKPNPTLADWNKIFDLSEESAKKFLEDTK